jgi:hypothetical protein
MHDGSETVARRFQVLLLGTMMMQFSRQCASSLFVIMIALRCVVVDVDGREERRGEERRDVEDTRACKLLSPMRRQHRNESSHAVVLV